MKRRNFIKMAGLVSIGAPTMISVLQSCSATSSYVNATYKDNVLQVKKSDFTVVKKDKTITRNYILVKHEAYPFPISLYKISENEYTALYMECTHQGCELNAYQTQLVCPCHGSEFDTRGKVLEGPADAPLKQFDLTTDEEHIYIKLL